MKIMKSEDNENFEALVYTLRQKFWEKYFLLFRH